MFTFLPRRILSKSPRTARLSSRRTFSAAIRSTALPTPMCVLSSAPPALTDWCVVCTCAGQSCFWRRRFCCGRVRFLCVGQVCGPCWTLHQPHLGPRLQLHRLAACHVRRVSITCAFFARVCAHCDSSLNWHRIRETKIKMASMLDIKSVPAVFNEHKSPVKSMAFDPNGDFVASADCTGVCGRSCCSPSSARSCVCRRRDAYLERRREAHRALEHAVSQDRHQVRCTSLLMCMAVPC